MSNAMKDQIKTNQAGWIKGWHERGRRLNIDSLVSSPNGVLHAVEPGSQSTSGEA